MTVSELLRSRKRFEAWMNEAKDHRVKVNENKCPIAKYIKDMYGDAPSVHGPTNWNKVKYYDKQGRTQKTKLPEWAKRFVSWFDSRYNHKTTPTIRTVTKEWEKYNA